MPIDQRIKNLAYRLDPKAWESYSGREKSHKQFMDIRRTRSLELAAQNLGRLSEPEDEMPRTTNERFARQVVDAIGRLTRAHIQYERHLTATGPLSEISEELDESEKNLTCLLTELQERGV